MFFFFLLIAPSNFKNLYFSSYYFEFFFVFVFNLEVLQRCSEIMKGGNVKAKCSMIVKGANAGRSVAR